MTKSSFSIRSLAVAGTAALLSFSIAGTVQAQGQDSGWFWGGGSTVGGSGREIVRFSPQHAPGQIIVSFGDRRLYHVVRPGEAVAYPIAIPREQSRWQGVTSVTMKRENPSWTPTPTMRAENPRLPNWVPGGHPMNPLGVRALYLGSSTYRIHGTDAPWTIGSAVSKGCIRMYNQDVVDLYPRVAVGTKVTVTWQSFRGGQGVASAPEPVSAGNAQQRRRVASVESQPSSIPSPFFTNDEDERPVRRRATLNQSQTQKKQPVAKRQPAAVTSAEATE